MVRCVVLPYGLVFDNQRAGYHVTEECNFGNMRILGLVMISMFVTLCFLF